MQCNVGTPNKVIRGCSHMTSAKNGGLQTPPPPLVSQSQKLAYPPSPLVRKNLKLADSPKEQPGQLEENPVHPDSLTWIYILFKIGHFGDISDFFNY